MANGVVLPPMTNKIRSLRDSVQNWASSHQITRKNEVMLSRLRIGHTRLTHGHLMRGEPIPPFCANCIVPLTVEHFLVECPDHMNTRRLFFGPKADLKTILSEPLNGNYNIQPIVNFIINIGYINDL